MNEYQLRIIVFRAQYYVVNWMRYFYYHLERRVDAILYRANFVKTMGKIRQLINHKKIMINDLVIDRPSITLKLGEYVSIKNFEFYRSNILYKCEHKQFFLYYSSYLEVNYKSLKIFVSDYPNEGSVFYPFKYNVAKFANFYRAC
jgi:small subunit ribosomal protein S4